MILSAHKLAPQYFYKLLLSFDFHSQGGNLNPGWGPRLKNQSGINPGFNPGGNLGGPRLIPDWTLIANLGPGLTSIWVLDCQSGSQIDNPGPPRLKNQSGINQEFNLGRRHPGLKLPPPTLPKKWFLAGLRWASSTPSCWKGSWTPWPVGMETGSIKFTMHGHHWTHCDS